MTGILYGIITILACTLGYFYSWHLQAKGNFKRALILLLICGFLLRLFTSADLYLHDWDERYHALVAKHLMQHPFHPTLYADPVLAYDYKAWTANHIWLHKQPLPLWSMALSMYLFGINEISLRLPSIMLSTLGIGLIFFIAAFIFNKKVAYLSALLFSLNGLIIELTAGRVATDHIDIFFLFFIMLAIYFSIHFSKNKKILFNILAGVSIGAAILSKWLPALIVLHVWFLLMYDSNKFTFRQIIFHFLILVVAVILICVPWQIYIFSGFPAEAAWEANFNLRHLSEVLEGQTGPLYYFLDQIRINYGELIYLPLVWFTFRVFKSKSKKEIAVLIWFLIPFVFFSIAKTKMQAYILFTCPALFMMTADFWYALQTYRHRKKYKWLINVILFLLIALPVRYTVERVKPFSTVDRKPHWVMDLKNLDKQNILNGVLFNYSRPVEAMFYTGLTVYPVMPDSSTIDQVRSRGYTIFINDTGNLPDYLNTMEGVRLIRLNSPP